MSEPQLPANRFRRLFEPPALLGDPIAQCLALLAVTSAFFLIFPNVDLWFSDLFYQPGDGFPMSHLKAFVGLRELHRTLTWVIGVGLVLALLLKLALPTRPSIVRPRDILFILSTLAIGPGLIINLVFKDNWGRPRPGNVVNFGGDYPFVGAWHISDFCQRNCSFMSGEGSSAIWLLTLAVLAPPRWRPLVVRILLAAAIVFSINRIAVGGHFLSDVLTSWWTTLAVMAVAWRILYVNPPAVLTNERMEADLTRTGTALRALFGRRR